MPDRPYVSPEYQWALEDVKEARELKSKFFFHWSILSGATFTLIIPFLSTLHSKGNLVQKLLLLKLAMAGLILSLLFSSLWNLFNAERLFRKGNSRLNLTAYSPGFLIFGQFTCSILAIVLYIVSLILLYPFILANI